jgi:hypothetical protein
VKEKIPKHWFKIRIENRVGEGVPDVFVCAEGVSFWIELKITKTNRINISSGQIAWNYALSQSGGVSFFLVSLPLNKNLYLFEGKEGRGLKDNGLATTGSGLVVPCLWSGSDWSGLFGTMLNFSRGRVGRFVASGSRSGRGQRVGVQDRKVSSKELMARLNGC